MSLLGSSPASLRSAMLFLNLFKCVNLLVESYFLSSHNTTSAKETGIDVVITVLVLHSNLFEELYPDSHVTTKWLRHRVRRKQNILFLYFTYCPWYTLKSVIGSLVVWCKLKLLDYGRRHLWKSSPIIISFIAKVIYIIFQDLLSSSTGGR